jgi:hypothetical protein
MEKRGFHAPFFHFLLLLAATRRTMSKSRVNISWLAVYGQLLAVTIYVNACAHHCRRIQAAIGIQNGLTSRFRHPRQHAMIYEQTIHFPGI